jgi:hypothetical protein
LPSPTISRPPSGNAGRFRRQQPAAPGRFGSMPGRKPTRVARRSASGPNRFGMPGRKPARQSRVDKALSSLTRALPSMGSSKSSRRKGGSAGKRAGGMALLAGGLGLAMKNRNKLTGMLNRGDHAHEQPQGASHSTGPVDTTPMAPPSDVTPPPTTPPPTIP